MVGQLAPAADGAAAEERQPRGSAKNMQPAPKCALNGWESFGREWRGGAQTESAAPSATADFTAPAFNALLHRYPVDDQKAHPAPVFLLPSNRGGMTNECYAKPTGKRAQQSTPLPTVSSKKNGEGRKRRSPIDYKIRERRVKISNAVQVYPASCKIEGSDCSSHMSVSGKRKI